MEWDDRLRDYSGYLNLRCAEKEGVEAEVWDLQPHQLRRSFLRMVVRYGEVSLRSLQLHCKHVNDHMTDYYIGTDSRLWLDFQEELRDFKVRVYAKALGETEVSGGGGRQMVKDINAAIAEGRIIKNFRGIAGEQVRLKWAERALQSGKQLHFFTTNFCDFRSSEARCNKGGDEPIAQFCSMGCRCAKVTSVHIPVWVIIYLETKEAIRIHKNSAILQLPLRKQLALAANVLKDLGVDPEAIVKTGQVPGVGQGGIVFGHNGQEQHER